MTTSAVATLGGIDAEASGAGATGFGAVAATLGGIRASAVVIGASGLFSKAFLYDTDCRTPIAAIPANDIMGVRYQRQLSSIGSGSFAVADDSPVAAMLTDFRMVKFYKYGLCMTGLIVKSSDVTHTVNGRVWRQYNSLPDQNGLLAEAVILPEFDLQRNSPSERSFGWFSRDTLGLLASHYVTPQSLQFSADTGARAGQPAGAGFDTSNPYWLARLNPYTTVPPNAANYFLRPFSLKRATDVRVNYTGDDFPTFYLDGTVLSASNGVTPHSWRGYYTATIRLSKGLHMLAYKVENAPLLPGHTNPVAAIWSMLALNDNGDVTGVLYTSDPSQDRVYDNSAPSPAWPRAAAFKVVIEEAITRKVRGPSLLHCNYTFFRDTDHNPWLDAGQHSVAVCSTTVADFGTQLAESQFDWHVDPRTLEVVGRVRWGTDRTGSVALTLARDGGNLVGYPTRRTAATATRLYAQLSDGSFTKADDATGQTAFGLIEAGASLSSVGDAPTAAEQLQAQLGETARGQVSVSAMKITSGRGPQPNQDFFIGDTITVPNHEGTGTMKVRVQCITVDETTPVPWNEVDVTEDLTA